MPASAYTVSGSSCFILPAPGYIAPRLLLDRRRAILVLNPHGNKARSLHLGRENLGILRHAAIPSEGHELALTQRLILALDRERDRAEVHQDRQLRAVGERCAGDHARSPALSDQALKDARDVARFRRHQGWIRSARHNWPISSSCRRRNRAIVSSLVTGRGRKRCAAVWHDQHSATRFDGWQSPGVMFT